jgi:hypothetical protein
MKDSSSVRKLSGRRSVLLAVLLWPALASAQPANTVVSTLRSTSTAATSVKVGCASTGPCTGGIVAGPVDVVSVTSAGFIGIASNVPASTANRLYNNASTLMWNGSPLSIGGSTVSGTIGKLAKFTGAAAVGDSICSESGTTITCVNTVSATTLTGTLSTAVQPNVTTMAGLTSASTLATVGTITSGTWQGTIIDLARGGAGVSLSGTGGASQFLRQNTVGGTVTVVRPAVADLSDNTNVPLLDGTLNYNTFATGLRSDQVCGRGAAAAACVTMSAGSTLASVSGTLISDVATAGNGVTNVGYSSVAFGGEVSPAALTANTDNYVIGAGFLARLAATGGSWNLTGIVAPTSLTSRVLWLVNLTSNTITLKNDQTSTAANRFFTPGAADYVLTQQKAVLIRYSNTDSRWIVLGGS